MEVTMPNHCTNEIYFSFKTEEDKDRFLKNVKGKDESGEEQPFTFNKIIPLPNRSEQFPNGKWDYNWCWKNWDTKWDCYELHVDSEIGDGREAVSINFFTAWGPPTKILQKILDEPKYSKGLEYVRWFYRDEADQFCGYLDDDCGLENGEVVTPKKFTGTYDA